MAKTAADLAKQIGRELMLIDAVSELEGEYDQLIRDMSESYHHTLPAYGVRVTWSQDEIPIGVFIPLARALAGVMASTFGEALPESEIQSRMRSLAAAAAAPYTGAVLQAEYY